MSKVVLFLVPIYFPAVSPIACQSSLCAPTKLNHLLFTNMLQTFLPAFPKPRITFFSSVFFPLIPLLTPPCSQHACFSHSSHKWFYWNFCHILLIYLFLKIFSYLFIFGCVGSLLQCAGFSLRWLLLFQSTGSRRMGFSSCGMRAQ